MDGLPDDSREKCIKETPCAYCGKPVANPEREHVFPKCLYPLSKSQSKVQRLTVPSCRDCNRGWARDEAHFRNVLVISGEAPNAARQELWVTSIRRSFDEVDGTRRVKDLVARMKPVTVAGRERHMIFPGQDKQVMRVIRKVIRGLCYHHNVLSPVSDQRVWADVLKYIVPQEFFDQMGYDHREQEIAQYRWQILNEDGINSVWLITFFERVTFIGLVSMSERGFG